MPLVNINCVINGLNKTASLVFILDTGNPVSTFTNTQ